MKKFDQKREEIKQAAIKSFAAYGYYKTTLDDIAKVLGLKKNSLYYYFENKEKLFREIIEDTIAEHLKEEKEYAEAALPASEKLLKLTECIVRFIRERSLEYVVSRESLMEIGKVIHLTFPDLRQHQKEVFKKVLDDGIAEGCFKPHDSTQLAADLAEMIPAFFNHQYVNSNAHLASEVDFEAVSGLIMRMTRYIMEGLKQN